MALKGRLYLQDPVILQSRTLVLDPRFPCFGNSITLDVECSAKIAEISNLRITS
jgi:hypothetical protein